MNKPAEDTTPEDTRTRLLRASLAVFGRRDFEAVSVREIVERADANIAAISYHFGGKQGLYLATAEFLADTLSTRLGPMMNRVRALSADADPATAAALLDEMIHGLVHNLLGDPLGDDAAGFILREQHQPTAAFDILYERLMLPIQQGFELLTSRLTHTHGSDTRQGILVTHALIGQIIAFRMARTTVLRRLGQPKFGEGDAREIAAVVSRLTLNALKGDNLRNTGS